MVLSRISLLKATIPHRSRGVTLWPPREEWNAGERHLSPDPLLPSSCRRMEATGAHVHNWGRTVNQVKKKYLRAEFYLDFHLSRVPWLENILCHEHTRPGSFWQQRGAALTFQGLPKPPSRSWQRYPMVTPQESHQPVLPVVRPARRRKPVLSQGRQVKGALHEGGDCSHHLRGGKWQRGWTPSQMWEADRSGGRMMPVLLLWLVTGVKGGLEALVTCWAGCKCLWQCPVLQAGLRLLRAWGWPQEGRSGCGTGVG